MYFFTTIVNVTTIALFTSNRLYFKREMGVCVNQPCQSTNESIKTIPVTNSSLRNRPHSFWALKVLCNCHTAIIYVLHGKTGADTLCSAPVDGNRLL